MADPVVTSHHAIAPSAAPDSTVRLVIDGREVTATAGEFLIAAAERAGTFIPRFCYHPRMKPVGMCRMCLVQVSGPRGATLQPACYVPVADGMEVDTTSAKVKKAQDGVLEFLLVNHPLDCPVCDKGGECPLQDQVLAYGPGESRFLEEKRHWAKPIRISELVLLDRERCIQCGRCVRFAAEVAGEAQIDFLGRGDTVEVNIFEDHAFTSYFSGNTVQICPVGALTAAPYRFRARPWDLEQVESTCTLCAFGCRAAVQSSADRVTRLLGIDSEPINHSWLCDKGRFGYEAVNADDRLVEPLVRRPAAGGGEALVSTSWAEALALVAERLSRARVERGPGSIGMLGGARLSNEDAYAWARLAKSVIGTDSVDAQLGDGLPAEVVLGLPRATIDDVCRARCVVVLAGDLREELPVLFLRLRGAAVDDGVPIVELVAERSALTPIATASLSYLPGEAQSLVAALAAAVHGDSARPSTAGVEAWDAALSALSRAGDGGEGVAVVLGRPSLAEHGELMAQAAAAIADAWPKARFLPALRRGNVMGALDMGLAPGVLPGRVSLDEGREWFAEAWGSVPSTRGRTAPEILRALAEGSMDALVLVGADPVGDFPDRALALKAIDRAGFVVAVDAFLSPSAALADVVLPAAMALERSGTTTNIEGRVTRLAPKVVPPGQCRHDWMIAAELAHRLGVEWEASSVGELWDDIERWAPSHAGITRAVLDAPGGRDGVIAPMPAAAVSIPTLRSLAPFDPMATPGIEPVEVQGAPLRAGLAEPLGGERDVSPSAPGGSNSAADGAGDNHGAGDNNGAGDNDGAGNKNGAGANSAGGEPEVGGAVGADASWRAGERASGPRRPRSMQWPQAVNPVRLGAPRDAASFRLVSPRRLYDGGVVVGACSSLAELAAPAVLRGHPDDLAQAGVRPGQPVRARTAHGALVLEAVADDGVPRGAVSIPFNLFVGGSPVGNNGHGGATSDVSASLIGADDAVVDVTLEVVEAAP